ncbi:hypothetical protein PFISCL1PPCAC_24060, partial [Pristionchus fissidentatus]
FREILTGLVYWRMEILPVFVELLRQIGKEIPFSFSFIASVESKVRDEIWRLSETGKIKKFEEKYKFVEASDHAWFRENWREGKETLGNVSEEYSLED